MELPSIPIMVVLYESIHVLKLIELYFLEVSKNGQFYYIVIVKIRSKKVWNEVFLPPCLHSPCSFPHPLPEISTLTSYLCILPEFLYVYINKHEYYFYFPLLSHKSDTVYTVFILLNNISCSSPHISNRERFFGSSILGEGFVVASDLV